VIRSFANTETRAVYNGDSIKKYQAIAKVARRKLDMIHAAVKIDDLRIPPRNMLKKLGGNRHDQWSIRINKRYRIVFYWSKGNAKEVEISKHYE